MYPMGREELVTYSGCYKIYYVEYGDDEYARSCCYAKFLAKTGIVPAVPAELPAEKINIDANNRSDKSSTYLTERTAASVIDAGINIFEPVRKYDGRHRWRNIRYAVIFAGLKIIFRYRNSF